MPIVLVAVVAVLEILELVALQTIFVIAVPAPSIKLVEIVALVEETFTSVDCPVAFKDPVVVKLPVEEAAVKFNLVATSKLVLETLATVN